MSIFSKVSARRGVHPLMASPATLESQEGHPAATCSPWTWPGGLLSLGSSLCRLRRPGGCPSGRFAFSCRSGTSATVAVVLVGAASTAVSILEREAWDLLPDPTGAAVPTFSRRRWPREERLGEGEASLARIQPMAQLITAAAAVTRREDRRGTPGGIGGG